MKPPRDISKFKSTNLEIKMESCSN